MPQSANPAPGCFGDPLAALDMYRSPGENEDMNANEKNGTVKSDGEIVVECVMAGKPIPPDVAKRVEEREKEIRERVFAEHGVQNIGVQYIREMRGPLPT